MNLKLPSVGRLTFLGIGCFLAALKYNIDRAIAFFCFHRPWYFWNYIEPHGVDAVNALPPQEWSFYLCLVLTSLPFFAVGMWISLGRLRSAGLSPLLCLLFFVPIVNLVFFAVLSVIPEKRDPKKKSEPAAYRVAGTVIRSALFSTVVVGLIGGLVVTLCVQYFQNYGWGLFVGLPFAMGLVAVLMYGRTEEPKFWITMLVSVLPVLFVGVGMFCLAAEGALCLIMAAPIGIVLALLGGFIGFIILKSHGHEALSPGTTSLIFLCMPFLMGMESQAHEDPPLLTVVTSVIVNAPPEKVWPNVISFPPIPPERDWILQTGIAYPTSSRMDGTGPGATRHCIFSTGEFVEPIQVWDEPRLLKFSVAAQPEPMEELSPYPHLKTQHLEGYLQSHQGQIRLVSLPGGKTLLEGTTWYTNKMWPVPYWQLWSDFIIHRIHLRVLNHIKNVSEQR